MDIPKSEQSDPSIIYPQGHDLPSMSISILIPLVLDLVKSNDSRSCLSRAILIGTIEATMGMMMPIATEKRTDCELGMLGIVI